jgi:hypothetical protein
VHRARHSHAQEHVVSHIMRRVAEYDNVTEVRLLLPHWQESHGAAAWGRSWCSSGLILGADVGRSWCRCGPILVQMWADLGRRCGSVLVQLSLSAGYSRHGLGAEVSAAASG